MKPLYLDQTATTKIDPRVLDEMMPFLNESYGNPSSMYKLGIISKRAINIARREISNLINTSPEEIIFTSGGTESINLAIKGLAFKYPNKKEIITTPIEHKATLKALHFLESLGYQIHYVNVSKEGFIDIAHLESLINSNTLLISVVWGNNEIGTIQDLKPIIQIKDQYQVILHVDAIQIISHYPIDLKKYNIDLMSLSAHKINGPKGVGLLYKRKEIALEPLIHGGSQEFELRGGTEFVAGIIGMKKALELCYLEKHQHIEYLNALSTSFLFLLKAKEDIVLNGPEIGPSRVPGQLSISFKYQKGFDLAFELDKLNIFVSTGSACNANSIEPSHVLKAINVDKDYILGTLRISFAHDITYDDISLLIYRLSQIL
jgi:cysteine desulfurase